MLNVTQATIQQYESGNPKVETLQKIATALGVSVSRLLGKNFSIFDILGPLYQENIERLIKIGEGMPSDVLQAFVNMLDGASDNEIDQIISFGRVYRSVSDKKPTGFNIVFTDDKQGDSK